MSAIAFIGPAAAHLHPPVPSSGSTLAPAQPDGLDRWALHGRLGLPIALLPAWRLPHPVRTLRAAMPRLAASLAVAGVLQAAWQLALPAL